MDDDIKKKKIRAGIIYAVIVLVLMFLINRFMNSLQTEDVLYSEFKSMVAEGKVTAVEINTGTGELDFKVKDDD